MKQVKISDVECSVGFEILSSIKERILKDRLDYENLDQDEYESYILEYLKVLSYDLSKTGEHRKNDWEKGWEENLILFHKNYDIKSLIPKYHTKSNIARLNKKIIKTFDPEFDFKLHSYIVDSVILKYASGFSKICEFGCGTGYHLFRIQKQLPEKKYFGLDWSTFSQKIISEVSNSLKLNVSGYNFDYFNPDMSFDIKGNLIYTVASLEQIGENHEKFLNYLLEKKPGLCIHFEPIAEVLDQDKNLLDHLTVKYFQKRNYLKNFLTKLRELEKEQKIEILETRRLNYGSKFIEGHTLIIWKTL